MKLFVSSLAFVAFCAFAVQALTSPENMKLNCMLKHLKDKDMIEKSFQKFPGSEAGDCSAIIEEKTKQFCDDAAKLKKLKKMKDCVVPYLKSHNYPELVMKDKVIMSSKINQQDKLARTDVIKREKNMSIEKSGEFCTMHKAFSDMFDETMENPPSTEEIDRVMQYCMRKHVMSKGEITAYQVDINPGKVNTKKAEPTCESFYANYTSFMKASIEALIDKYFKNEIVRACVRTKVLKTRIIDELLILEVLSELELTAEQIATEKKRFMKFNDGIMEQVLSCV